PNFMFPEHWPISDTKELQAMIYYQTIARQRVHCMMDKGMALDEIRKQFHMNEYKDWDRTQHLPITAAAIYRELRGEGAEITPSVYKTVKGTIAKIQEEGRYLGVTSDTGQSLALRISNASDIEGIADRPHFTPGMKLTAQYEGQQQVNEVLEMKIMPRNTWQLS